MVLAPDFVYLHHVEPSIQQDIRYATSNNFVGRKILGYRDPVCVLTGDAAAALKNVQKEFTVSHGYSLLVFDCYRPLRAGNDFKRWSADMNDQKNKAQYYPNVDKKDFFDQGYILEISAHSRGSTVDLTLVDQKTGHALDMGTGFDFMDPRSSPHSTDVTPVQYRNRMLLRTVMEKHGFQGIDAEWWHFTLRAEPYKDRYFHFDVQRDVEVVD